MISNRAKKFIGTLFLSLLVSGMLISTLHTHQNVIVEDSKAYGEQTTHSNDPSHRPVCAFIFQVTYTAPLTGESITWNSDLIPDILPLFTEQVFETVIYGRDPPAGIA